jgi:hypothetical protein
MWHIVDDASKAVVEYFVWPDESKLASPFACAKRAKLYERFFMVLWLSNVNDTFPRICYGLNMAEF